jgi:hypothetical protein
MASATARRAAAAASRSAAGAALPHGHCLTLPGGMTAQRHRTVRHRHLPGSDHLIPGHQAGHAAIADGDKKALAAYAGKLQHALQRRGRVIDLRERLGRRRSSCVAALHARWLAEQKCHGHVHGRCVRQRVVHAQVQRLGWPPRPPPPDSAPGHRWQESRPPGPEPPPERSAPGSHYTRAPGATGPDHHRARRADRNGRRSRHP